MFVTLNVVEHENRAVTWWKLLDSTFKIYPVHGPRQPQIRASASLNSRTAVGLVRATGPVGTHQLVSMPSLLHKVVYSHYLLSIRGGCSRLPRGVWGRAGRSGVAWTAVLRQAGSALATICAERRFGFRDGLGVSETTVWRNAGNSSSGSTQKNDFNTMVVSRRLVFRS